MKTLNTINAKIIKIKMFSILILFSCTILLNSCDTDEYDIQLPNEVEGSLVILEHNLSGDKENVNKLIFTFKANDRNHLVKLESSVKNNQLNSLLTYKKDGNSEWIKISNFNINLDENYKQDINLIVEKQAKSLKGKHDFFIIDEIVDILEGLPELLFDELGKNEYFNEATLSVFYHMGAFKTAKRAYEIDSEDCNCGVYENFVNNKTPFFCPEDKIVSADEVYDLIMQLSEENKFAGKQFNPEKLLSYLKSKSGDFIYVNKVDKIFKKEFKYFWNKKLSKNERAKVLDENYILINNSVRMNIPRRKTSNLEDDDDDYTGWPVDLTCFLYGVRSGRDCGCCFNYSGPCWTCSLLCYYHDHDCITCLPRLYCLPGCVPGPC